MISFSFQKSGIAAYSPTEHSHISYQIRVAQQAEANYCDEKIGNLDGLKAGSDVLLDNFLDIYCLICKDRINLKCSMYATQGCQSGHRHNRREFL